MTLPPIPGTQLEKAAANVAEHGGKSFINALSIYLNSWTKRWAATNEEVRKDIVAEGVRRRKRADVADRHEREVLELEHRRRLLERGIGRVEDEIIHAQRSIEYVVTKAIEYHGKETEAETEAVRDFEDDWLRRFFRYAADVDEQTILDVFAQALSEARLKGRRLLSPKALDTVRFFEAYSLDMSEYCANLIGAFEAVPRGFLEKLAANLDRDLDLSLLVEMGLIKYESQAYFSVLLGGFQLSFYYNPSSRDEIHLVRLTHVGRSMIGLRQKIHRELGDPLTFGGSAEEKLALQEALGVTATAVEMLGTALVAELSNAQSMEAQVRVNGAQVLRSEKNAYADPFNLAEVDLRGLSARNLALARRILEAFRDFDTKQADALRDQTSVYPDIPPAD